MRTVYLTKYEEPHSEFIQLLVRVCWNQFMKGFLLLNLEKKGLDVETQLGVPVIYKEIEMNQGFRMDLLVNNKVIVEIKSVETLLDVHHKQLLTYLKLSDKKLGLLINSNVSSLKNSITRIVNNL